MRKIYSLVLMAAMLLVGTNAWATTYTKSVATYDELIAAVEGGTDTYAANDVVNITLTADLPFTLEAVPPTFTYTEAMLTDAKAHICEIYVGQTVNVDLNGHSITSDALFTFAIYKGKLNITGRGTISNTLHRYNTSGQSTKMKEASVVWLAGVNDPNCTPQQWSYLSVGSEVNLMCNYGKCGIYVNNLYTTKLDVACDEITASTSRTYKSADRQLNWSTYDGASKCAYGVYVDVYGTVHGHRYGMQLSGNINVIPASSDVNLPEFHLHTGATSYADHDATECCGVYMGGYGKAVIEGTAYGSTGVYIKSGEVEVNNATIYSNADTYVAPTGASGSGATASGSGIVMDTNKGYAGNIEVTITGDTHVSGSAGYAIQDVVTKPATPGQTNVEALTITGGTFDTGAEGEGTITISENTANANADNSNPTNVTIGGGNVEGTITVGDNDETPHDLNEVVKPTGDNTEVHATFVTDENGKTTMVIVQGAAPDDKTTVKNQTGKVNWKHADDSDTTPMSEDIDVDVTLESLTMNQAYTQALYVKGGHTLTVDRIIMGADAHIVVEPTAKLIVNGTEGIVTTSVTNLVLQANETTQGALLFNPAATSNRQPHGQVQYTTTAHQLDAAGTNYSWQRITSPLAEVTEVTATLGGRTTWDASPMWTAIYEWDYANNAWSTSSINFTQMKPFVGYTLTNNVSSEGVRYNFKGRIQGTVSDELVFPAKGWNYFGNAYTSSMHIKTMLQNLNNSNVEGSAYLWIRDHFVGTTLGAINKNMADIDTIPALQTIILYLSDNATPSEMTAKMNYNKSVWEWGTKTGAFAPSAGAPQRGIVDINSVRILITAADGTSDYVTLMETDEYSEEYEGGEDLRKLMTPNHINMYAMTDEPLAIVATNNLRGTLLSLQTMDEVSYTMSFDKVNGEVYALRDNLTNTVVLMNEGATYNFTAQSNATLDGRFQIVSRQEMPTAVETVEETVNAPKAIYTIMGQYVGETTDWNNLPAGVYVVDGVKIVK